MLSYVKSFFSGLLGLDQQQPKGKPKRTIKITAVIDEKVKQQKKDLNSTFWETCFKFFKNLFFSPNEHVTRGPSKISHPKNKYIYNPQDEQWIINEKKKQIETLDEFYNKTFSRTQPGVARKEFVKAFEKQKRELNFKYEEKFKEIQDAPLDFIKFVNYGKKRKK